MGIGWAGSAPGSAGGRAKSNPTKQKNRQRINLKSKLVSQSFLSTKLSPETTSFRKGF
jgi:hypothetical protein